MTKQLKLPLFPCLCNRRRLRVFEERTSLVHAGAFFDRLLVCVEASCLEHDVRRPAKSYIVA